MTSIEWLIEQLQAPCRGIPSNIIEQAKEMHKQEIIDAVNGYTTTELIGVTKGEYYYTENYTEVDVSKGSDNSPKEENKTSFGEISDEEIWAASIKYDNGATYDTPIVHFQQGAFWYREQLKQRQ